MDGKVCTGLGRPGQRPTHPLISSQVCYLPARGKLETLSPRDTPNRLGAKLAVLRLLTCYMQRRLREVRPGLGGGGGGLGTLRLACP